MLLLIQLLGPDYVVWDKAARIEFRQPGTGCVRAVVRIDDDVLAAILRETQHGAAYHHEFQFDILDERNEIVAAVHKTLYVRRRGTT